LAAQGLQGLHLAAAQGLAAQGLQGLQAAAAQGLGLAAAQGLGFAAAQGLQGFFGAQAARAGSAITAVPVRTAPPTATPANTTNGTIVVDRSILFLDCLVSCPPDSRSAAPGRPAIGAASGQVVVAERSPI
jgi:hypothetical protein